MIGKRRLYKDAESGFEWWSNADTRTVAKQQRADIEESRDVMGRHITGIALNCEIDAFDKKLI